MTEMQVISLLGALVGLFIAALTVWKFIEGRINAAHKEAVDKAGAAAASATYAQTLLAEHKLHVAETYITKAGMREFRDEVMTGVRELKGSVSTLHERIDQLILADRPAAKRQARAP